MENLKYGLAQLAPFLNPGEKIQSSLLGHFTHDENNIELGKKGVLCATNERVCFFTEAMDVDFSAIDYYKIDEVQVAQLPSSEFVFYYNGTRHTLAIEEGDIQFFQHFIIDRMEIKS